MKIKTLILAAVGISAIVFGVVWMSAVFPSLKKIPTDYNQTVDFRGSYRLVANQEFYLELFANPAIGQLFASPQSLILLSQPSTQQLLANEEVVTLLSNPELVQRAISDPESVGQEVLGAVTELLGNPVIAQLLSDPAVQGLLADPVALQLMMNPLTSRLIASGGQPELASISIDFHRVRTATKTEGDILFLDQEFSARLTGSGEPLPQFSSTSLLAVDRDSRQYVEGGSEPRRGGFAFPFNVSKDQTYPIWIHEVYQPLTASFVGTSEVEGLAVYTFKIQETGLAVPDEAKLELGLPASLGLIADVVMNTQTDPKSGITVQLDSKITYRLDNPALGNPIVFEAEISDTEDSVRASVDDARTAKRQLFWLGIILPWTVLGLGILAVGIAGLLFVKTRE